LNVVTLDEKQSIAKDGLDRDTIPDDSASRQYNHLIDCRI
jgi:hypothetical protein